MESCTDEFAISEMFPDSRSGAASSLKQDQIGRDPPWASECKVRRFPRRESSRDADGIGFAGAVHFSRQGSKAAAIRPTRPGNLHGIEVA